jgi:NTE family protein
VALALQGGGAHGAFTWGVLDRLLEEPSCRIEAISGASAGAINAAVLASGYLAGGAAGARAQLDALWRRLAALARLSPLQATPVELLVLGRRRELSAAHAIFDFVSRIASPYQLNPLDLNPLRELLVELVDFDRLTDTGAIPLYVSATNVETSECRIFTSGEITASVLLASACLPTIHKAVRLDNGHYWDGGFTANPPVLPLVEQCESEDIVVVRTIPRYERGAPLTARGIQARLARIVFDGPLKGELAALGWLRRMAETARLDVSPLGRRLAALRLHTIAADEALGKLGSASRLHPDWHLVHSLKELGRAAATEWLVTRGQPDPAEALDRAV